MSNNLFQNSKAALGFVAVTLVCAVALVGTSDNNGMLPKLAQRYGGQPPAAEPSAAAAETPPPTPPKQQVSGWYDAPASAPTPPTAVFGDYDRDNASLGTAPQPLVPTPSSPVAPATTPARPNAAAGGGAMHAPLSPNAVIVN
jgi:hypothetical protein